MSSTLWEERDNLGSLPGHAVVKAHPERATSGPDSLPSGPPPPPTHPAFRFHLDFCYQRQDGLMVQPWALLPGCQPCTPSTSVSSSPKRAW